MKKVVSFFIRVFIVTLSFIMDVKVHADIVVQAVTGPVEIERDSPNLNVQTYSGSARFIVEDKKIGVERGSIFSIDKAGEGQLSKGNVFVSIPFGKSSSFTIHSPQGDLRLEHGDFYVEVNATRTQLNVLLGSAAIIDRALKKEVQIKAGYSSWLGGLLATGQHSSPLRAEACELTRITEKIRTLMSLTDKEFQTLNKTATPFWKDAVIKVADDSQSAIDNDIKVLNQILAREQLEEEKISHEQAALRKLFRSKTLGVPSGSTESPSGSDRDPASDLE